VTKKKPYVFDEYAEKELQTQIYDTYISGLVKGKACLAKQLKPKKSLEYVLLRKAAIF
jgi:hypothetical protein